VHILCLSEVSSLVLDSFAPPHPRGTGCEDFHQANGQNRLVEPRLLLRTRHNREKRATMRSDLVYSAGLKVENRFLLATIVMRAVKMLHIQSTRTEDTANHVFAEIAAGRGIHARLPEIAPLPTIEPLMITSAA
jgi:hypothetical protein